MIFTQMPREFVGNKVNGRISKRVFQENKTRQIYRKTNISYQGVRNVCFSENLTCFVFLKTRLKIRPFTLLPTNSPYFLVCINNFEDTLFILQLYIIFKTMHLFTRFFVVWTFDVHFYCKLEFPWIKKSCRALRGALIWFLFCFVRYHATLIFWKTQNMFESY